MDGTIIFMKVTKLSQQKKNRQRKYQNVSQQHLPKHPLQGFHTRFITLIVVDLLRGLQFNTYPAAVKEVNIMFNNFELN